MKIIFHMFRRAALLLAMSLLFSAVAFASNNVATELEQAIASTPAATRSNVWRYYSDALVKQEAGDYSGAMRGYFAALKFFAANGGRDGNDINEINAYRQIAECSAASGEYGMAAAAYGAAAQKSEAFIAATPGAGEKVEEKISYERSAAALRHVTELYVKTDDPERGSGSYFDVPGEPVNGFVVGAYAEADERVHDAYGSKRYWNEYPKATGVTPGVYLLYLDYGMPLSHYESHIQAAREQGFAIELAIQPRSGLACVYEDDEALVHLARDVEASGVQFYIRFANEMNDTSGSNPWYTADASEYIRAFRAVADVIHTCAPSAAVVWAPNYYPDYNIDDYYPGDDYVDIVGVSLYMTYRPELNPLGTGVENRRWIDDLDAIYSRYGDRKPLMIAEGAVGFSTADGLDLTDFAVEQVRDLYCYLPIRYPNVKLAVWFDSFDVVGNDVYSCLTGNQTVLNAYRKAVNGSESVLTSVDAPAAPVYYGRLSDGSELEDGVVTLCSYVKSAVSVACVRYAVDGKTIGVSYAAPYELTADFSDYSGTSVNLTVSSYYADGSVAGEDTFVLCVAGAAPTVEPEPAPARPMTEGVAYERTLTFELNGKPVTLSAYAIKDERGNETSFVGLRELGAVLSGTEKRFYVGWDGVAVNVETGSAFEPAKRAVKLTGDRPYRVNTAETRINGVAASLESFVLEDDNGGGYVYYKLRDLGDALGFTVDWDWGSGLRIGL